MVTMTSCAPRRAFSQPTSPPNSSPPASPASTETTRCSGPGTDVQAKAAYEAQTAPAMVWPCPPMLNIPARNATEIPSPPKISGVAASSVLLIGPKNWVGVPLMVAGLKIAPSNSAE